MKSKEYFEMKWNEFEVEQERVWNATAISEAALKALYEFALILHKIKSHSLLQNAHVKSFHLLSLIDPVPKSSSHDALKG